MRRAQCLAGENQRFSFGCAEFELSLRHGGGAVR